MREPSATRRSPQTRWPVLFLCLAAAVFLLSASASAQVDVTATAGNTGPVTYTTLKLAFDAVNDGTHQGVITMAVTADTTETVPAVLNASGSGAAVYTAVTISPTGGAARTISGAIAAGSPLIDLNGADSVTIDGLNTGGNSLTIANTTVAATSGTSTIRFIGDATSNLITNASILGSSTMATTTNGGTIYFGAGAVSTGNDNNTISNCNIGPVGANLPTKAVFGNGSTTSTATYNSGIVITGNNIFDYFNAAAQSNGIYLGGANADWTISNNRFYQTATRTQTTGAVHAAIQAASSTGNTGHLISGNTIGYASSAGTGIYTFVGVSASSKFLPIYFSSAATTAASSIQGNTITAISLSGVVGGTGTTAAFVGISVNSGLINIGNVAGNTIGSPTTAGAITIANNNASASEILGIYYFPTAAANIANNVVAGIAAANSGAGSQVIYGIRAFTGSAVINTIQNNTVGTAAAPISNTSAATATRTIGLYCQSGACVVTGNTISNLSMSAPNVGTGSTASLIGLWIDDSSATLGNNVSQNTVRFLSNNDSAAAVWVTGMQYNGATTGTHLVQRNFIHSLTTPSTSATATVNGINVQGGTTTYQNNMVAVGTGMTANSPQINGINETVAGTDNFYHNSVFIGGAAVAAGTANSFAFQSSITTNTRNYRDNVFYNARSNGAATGKHYAARVGGTTPNPAGLTSNNNVLYAPGTGGFVGLFNLLDQTTLGDWQSATGQDLNSFAADPQYLAPIAATPDLHINPAVTTPVEGNGFLIAAVADDFDGQTRSALTPVDVGADAGVFLGVDLAPPSIVFTPLVNSSSAANRTLATTITDLSGVPTAGIGLPVIYFRKGTTDPYSANQCVFVSGSSYDCVLDYTLVTGGSVTAGDTIQYFVAAQDTVGNVTTSPSAGAAGLTANPPAAATPPTTPASYLIAIPLSGPLTVGTGGSYLSLTNPGGLFEAINNNVLTGNLTVDVTSDLTAETGAVALNQWVEEGTGGYTLLIRPSGGPRVISGTSTGTTGLVKLNGADRVTIDGSTSGGTDRSLTITNLNTGGVVIWIASASASNGAGNNTVKNCLISGFNSGTTSTIGGVLSSSGTTLGGDAEAPNSNNTLQNNVITTVQNAAYLRGGATLFDQNWLVEGNTFGSAVVAGKLTFRGMLIGNAESFTIRGNTILGVVSYSGSSSTMHGIQVALAVNGGTIAANSIADIKQTNTAGWGSAGITLGASNTNAGVNVFNNMITDVASFGFAGVGSADNGYGLVVATGGGYGIYANSINLNTNQTAAGSITAAVNILSTVTAPGAVNLRDNILADTQTIGTRYGVYSAAPATVFSAIDFNDYFAQNVGFLGSAQATLAAWQTATGQDANSLAVDPLFVSPSDLHLQSTSPMIGVATPIAAVTVDFDGDSRDLLAPDIGADEVGESDLSITKTDGVTTAFPGGSVTYTITASNPVGPNAVVGGTVADAFPATLTCNWTCVGASGGTCSAAGAGAINDTVNLPVGGSVTYTAVCSVASAAVGTLVNTATVSSPNLDPDPSNNSATDTDTLTPQADLGISKSDGVVSAFPGGTLTYTIIATNLGPSDAPGSTVADTFPAVLSCSTTCIGSGGGTCTAGPVLTDINDIVNLPAGGSVTYTAVCTVSGSATGTISNTATVTGSVTDPVSGNNSATDIDTVNPAADVSITKTDGVTTVSTGQTVTYTIVASNAGPSVAPASAVIDIFPTACTGVTWTCVGAGGGSCNASGSGNINETVNLPVSSTVTFTASCTVAGNASGTLSNTASIGVGAGDPNSANNSATDVDTIVVLPLLSDGFESGDLSAWGGVQTLFRVYQVLPLGQMSAVEFGYDLAALPVGGFVASPIAKVADDGGRTLFTLVARRSEASAPFELSLEVVGGGASEWVSAAGSQVRFDWAAGSEGHVAVALDGRLLLWVDGFAAATQPVSVELLRSE